MSDGQGAHQKEMQVGVSGEWACACRALCAQGYGALSNKQKLLMQVCLQHRLGRQDEKGDHEEEQQLQGEAQGKLAHAG
jgi:hypothetical protein